MATKKSDEATAAAAALNYETVLKEYTTALDQMRSGDLAGARERFDAIVRDCRDEPELAERSRIYGKICARKLAPTLGAPASADECYYRAVMMCNEGRAEEAIALLDTALVQDPRSVRVLYARACAWALQRNAERAVSDLRSAIALDPTVRFQAVNDSDFERVREEPSFIDVIEPTPTGA